MGGPRYVIALGEFIIDAPLSMGQAKTLLSLLRVLYLNYLGAYRDYRGVVMNIDKLAHKLATWIVREFGIECGESGFFLKPCLIIYEIDLEIPPMIFGINGNATFEDVLREVLRRGFAAIAGDLHVGAIYVYRRGGRLRVGRDYFRVIADDVDNVYIEYREP